MAIRQVLYHSMLVFTLGSLLAGCTQLARPDYTAPVQRASPVPGYGDIRLYADAPVERLRTTRTAFVPERKLGQDGMDFLALSSGGADGAFGAGLLVGWSESGTRPSFDLVTGISAGAIIAPFAFVGPSQDDALKEIWTSGEAERLNGTIKLSLGNLIGKSERDGQPLRDLIARYVDDTFLARVAARHRSGARLLIVTTNLDAERSVVWNMGAIAASGRSDALELFRTVIAASASIPTVFPAVEIETEVNGELVRELHVDGAVGRSVFIVPDAILASTGGAAYVRDVRPTLHVVVNGSLSPRFEKVSGRGLPVAERSLSVVTKAGARATIAASFSLAGRLGLTQRLQFMDEAADIEPSRGFDTDYMREIFAQGRMKGKNNEWYLKAPVGGTVAGAG